MSLRSPSKKVWALYTGVGALLPSVVVGLVLAADKRPDGLGMAIVFTVCAAIVAAYLGWVLVEGFPSYTFETPGGMRVRIEDGVVWTRGFTRIAVDEAWHRAVERWVNHAHDANDGVYVATARNVHRTMLTVDVYVKPVKLRRAGDAHEFRGLAYASTNRIDLAWPPGEDGDLVVKTLEHELGHIALSAMGIPDYPESIHHEIMRKEGAP